VPKLIESIFRGKMTLTLVRSTQQMAAMSLQAAAICSLRGTKLRVFYT
jgi:hypothetical protein